MENSVFTSVFANATTELQVNNAFAEAVSQLIIAKKEYLSALKSGKTKKVTTKTSEKKSEPKTAKKSEPKTTEISKDCALDITKNKKGEVVKIDLKPEIIKSLKLHISEHEDGKRFWIYGDTKAIATYLSGVSKKYKGVGRYWDARHSQCKDEKNNTVEGWIFYKTRKDNDTKKSVDIESTFRKAFNI